MEVFGSTTYLCNGGSVGKTGKEGACGRVAGDETGKVGRDRSRRPLWTMLRELLDGKRTSFILEMPSLRYKWHMSRR